MKPKIFIAKVKITHKLEGKLYHPGDEIDLSHLNNTEIQQLIDMDVIEKKPRITRKQEAENGTNN